MSTNGSTALAREDHSSRIVKRDEAGFTESEIDLIKTQIAPGVTDGELKLFMHVCKSRHLDPVREADLRDHARAVEQRHAAARKEDDDHGVDRRNASDREAWRYRGDR
jgi:hypothetical protein